VLMTTWSISEVALLFS